MTRTRFTPEELSYLRDQRLGRLATVDEQHAPQVVPVGFFVDERTCEVSIGGIALGSTRKFRNVEATGRAALDSVAWLGCAAPRARRGGRRERAVDDELEVH